MLSLFKFLHKKKIKHRKRSCKDFKKYFSLEQKFKLTKHKKYQSHPKSPKMDLFDQKKKVQISQP